ncbi:trypsin-like [Zeugodacus cucurbitae]|uniref:trypsin-like n=1 Tax=Zeugodacus cucurbitae TaxID=28588 RepID=UPI0023D93940|nr:trypsin-like [Zeugodacus cucurbitae]
MTKLKCCELGILLPLILLIQCNYIPHIAATNGTIAVDVLPLTNDTITKKIIGGDFVSILGAPFMVNLRLDNEFVCGGTLLRPNCVLTAAHCVIGTPAFRFDVQAGTTILSSPGQVANVESIFIPRQYSKATKNYDVAIMRLDRPLSGSRVQLVTLGSDNVRPGQRLRVYGWGRRREDGASAVALRAAVVRVIRRAECNRVYRQDDEGYLSRTMFCASAPGIKDSCSGDSGGPLMFRGRQYGIVSWGIGCGRTNFPGVYTSIRAVQPWINQIVAQHCQ